MQSAQQLSMGTNTSVESLSGYRLFPCEHRRQMLVGQAPLVHRDPAIADIVHVDMTGKQAVEFGDHGWAPSGNARCRHSEPEAATGQTGENAWDGLGRGAGEKRRVATLRSLCRRPFAASASRTAQGCISLNFRRHPRPALFLGGAVGRQCPTADLHDSPGRSVGQGGKPFF